MLPLCLSLCLSSFLSLCLSLDLSLLCLSETTNQRSVSFWNNQSEMSIYLYLLICLCCACLEICHDCIFLWIYLCRNQGLYCGNQSEARNYLDLSLLWLFLLLSRDLDLDLLLSSLDRDLHQPIKDEYILCVDQSEISIELYCVVSPPLGSWSGSRSGFWSIPFFSSLSLIVWSSTSVLLKDKFKFVLTIQRSVVYCVNQSEVSGILCQPIRNQWYIVSTNQRWVTLTMFVVGLGLSLADAALSSSFSLIIFSWFTAIRGNL